jgi:prepilin-type N-terminal cleavage/methylation domain-containing protein
MKVINNKQGFTLIELLVVVAIIGILSAVGVVAYNGYTAGAKKSACKGNHKTMVKTVYENIMLCEINPTIDIAWSGSAVLRLSCGSGYIQAYFSNWGDTEEEILAYLSVKEIGYSDLARNNGIALGHGTWNIKHNSGQRTTLQVMTNPYAPGSQMFYGFEETRRLDEIELSLQVYGYDAFGPGRVTLQKQDEDGKPSSPSTPGSLWLYSNCGGELVEHKFEF